MGHKGFDLWENSVRMALEQDAVNAGIYSARPDALPVVMEGEGGNP